MLKELPTHLRDMATFTLATGLRAANVTGLAWEQVDLERKVAWVHPDQAKARKATAVPLNAAAIEVLARQRARHAERVFTYEGAPVRQLSTKAWYKALMRVGIADFEWHDLRHTWASWHVQAGTPLLALQELAGWESERMVRRYAHLAADHLAVYASHLEIDGTNRAQSVENPMVATGGRAYGIELIDENWCRLRDLNPRPTVYKAAIWNSRGLYINDLQRLPAPPQAHQGTITAHPM